MPTLTILLLLVLAGAPSQRIESQSPDRARITRVETAMNHLTVIELAEPVTLAAAGSPLFKVERRDNKVFIQPLEEGSSTNLFVWTASGRWSYELVPAVSPATMHFAIDEQAVPVSQSRETERPENPQSDVSSFSSLAEEMLLFAKPIRSLNVKSDPEEVGAFITDVYRKEEQLFIRYVIDNRTTKPFAIGIPEVFVLESAQSATSLQSFRYTQVGPSISKKIRSRGQVRIETIDCEVPSEPLPPGERVAGILIVKSPPANSEPTVLKFSFPHEKRQPVVFTLVL
jgi:hypothetical protein